MFMIPQKLVSVNHKPNSSLPTSNRLIMVLAGSARNSPITSERVWRRPLSAVPGGEGQVHWVLGVAGGMEADNALEEIQMSSLPLGAGPHRVLCLV